MNEEFKCNYYAIIPATVRYDSELKAAEKLLYGEITALANRYGYCFAQNRYFADLYGVTISTVSKWISHLQKLEYIRVFIERNDKNEIVSRKIFINDTPYGEKRQHPYCEKAPYPIVKNSKDNNINYNMIEDIFISVLNKSTKISKEFYNVLEKLELLYDEITIKILAEDKKQMIKEIIYTLYDLHNSNFNFILKEMDRQHLLNVYLFCKDVELKNINTKNQIEDFIKYYKKSLVNQYTNNL